MDNNTVVYVDYGGGTPRTVSMLDVESGGIVAWNRIYAGDVYDLTQDYVIENNGARADTLYSAEVLSRQAVREEDSTGRSPYSRSLSIDYDVSPYKLFFNSRYEATLPDRNQILVLTWDADAVLDKNILTGSIDTNLQLWNLDTNELDLIIPGGIYGRYSPNGRFLTFFNPAHELIIYNLENGKFLAPVTAVLQIP